MPTIITMVSQADGGKLDDAPLTNSRTHRWPESRDRGIAFRAQLF